MVKSGLIGIMFIAIAGCSTVHISGTKPSTSWNLGLIKLQVPPGGEVPTLIATEGLGLTIATQSVTLGWLSEVVVLVPDSTKCRVFMIVRTHEELEALKEAFAQNSELFENICIFSKEGESWSH